MDALTKFDHIAIQFTTGNDNLRSNSELTADVYNKTGAPLAADLLLHEQDGGTWDNNSTSPRIVVSMPVETEVSSLDRIDVVLRSHNDAFQNDDEWHVNGVLVELVHQGVQDALVWTNQKLDNFPLKGRGGKSNVMSVFANSIATPS